VPLLEKRHEHERNTSGSKRVRLAGSAPD
jgi:hypothetical protein